MTPNTFFPGNWEEECLPLNDFDRFFLRVFFETYNVARECRNRKSIMLQSIIFFLKKKHHSVQHPLSSAYFFREAGRGSACPSMILIDFFYVYFLKLISFKKYT